MTIAPAAVAAPTTPNSVPCRSVYSWATITISVELAASPAPNPATMPTRKTAMPRFGAMAPRP